MDFVKLIVMRIEGFFFIYIYNTKVSIFIVNFVQNNRKSTNLSYNLSQNSQSKATYSSNLMDFPSTQLPVLF